MSWSLTCCKCGNDNYDFFERKGEHLDKDDIIKCIVCSNKLRYHEYGMTTLLSDEGKGKRFPSVKPVPFKTPTIIQLTKGWGKKKVDRFNELKKLGYTDIQSHGFVENFKGEIQIIDVDEV